MRFVIAAAALAAACLAAPAQAAPHLYVFDYQATAYGQQIVYDPNATPFCGTPGAPAQACYGTAPFTITLGGQVQFFNETGTGDFAFGSFCANCTGWGGTITGGFNNGIQAFSGVNFAYQNGSTSLGSSYASASSFYVRLVSIDGQAVPGPVPEPATWAMMIIGFAGIGAALRRRQSKMAERVAVGLL